MSKVISRLLVFFIGIPIVIGIVICPFINHLPLHLLICLACAFGTSEFYDIIEKDHKLLPKKFVVGLSVLISVTACLSCVLPGLLGFSIPGGLQIITFIYIVSLIAVLFAEVFTAKEFKNSIDKIASSSYILTYTGFLLTFLSRMTVWTMDGKSITIPAICIFLLMVFFTDSIAWFTGVLFGKNNRGVVMASPNKSIAGFIGGFIGAIGAGVLGYFVWSSIFSEGLLKLIITGIAIAFSSIVGDLAESVFKRSAEVKDSGNIVPGRGGVLDSIDSIIMSAPVFYLLFTLFFGPFN